MLGKLAMKIAGDVPAEPVETRQGMDAEARELRDLRANIEFGRYIAAAMAGGGVHNGPELEYNQHLGIASSHFPMELVEHPNRWKPVRPVTVTPWLAKPLGWTG